MPQTDKSFITEFLKLESAGGLILFAAALLAMVCANTALAAYYELLL
ncbi:MAG: Na+/H+ antiporter NhaA, partial [Arenicella sp.]|nr:Na+/H+ antiporter NhaA [Arenicella sp.]